jgi:hypothetical protein
MNHCPDPELLALAAEGRLDPAERDALVEHAADCALCRRHLAIASLPEAAPGRVLSIVWSVAAAALVAVAVWFAVKRPDAPRPEEARREEPKREEPRPEEPKPEPPKPEEPRPEPPKPEDPKPDPPKIDPPVTPKPEDPKPEPPKPEDPKPEPPKVEPPKTEPPKVTPPKTESVPEKPRRVEPGVMARAAILDPFGLVHQNEPVESAMLLATDAVVTAKSAAGFRMQDGTRVQLLPGASAGVFASDALKTGGLRLTEGTALVTPPVGGGSVYVARNGHGVVVEGAKFAFLLHADPKAETLEISTLGQAITLQPEPGKKLTIEKGEAVTIRRDAVEPSKKSASARLAAQFRAWPEDRQTLLYLGFERDDVEVTLKTGAVTYNKEGQKWAAAAGTAKKKMRIEVVFAKEIESPKDMILRIRYRTLAQRIVVSPFDPDQKTEIPPNSGTPIPVPLRERSATEWTTGTMQLPPTTGWSWYGTQTTGKKRGLSFEVDVPSSVDAEKMVFDIDSIELLRK